MIKKFKEMSRKIEKFSVKFKKENIELAGEQKVIERRFFDVSEVWTFFFNFCIYVTIEKLTGSTVTGYNRKRDIFSDSGGQSVRGAQASESRWHQK